MGKTSTYKKIKKKARSRLLNFLKPHDIMYVSKKEQLELERLKKGDEKFSLELEPDLLVPPSNNELSKDKDDLEELKTWLGDTDRDHIWIFNSGNLGGDFRGNPKYLFVYINNYRPDIKAIWIGNDPDTIDSIKSLGFMAYVNTSSSAGYLFNCAGVMVDEQIRIGIPLNNDIKYLNLWHGWGFKPVERSRVDDDDDLRFVLCPKYIQNNTFYMNNQIVAVVNSLQEEYFKTQIGVEKENFLRAGYARCIYQKKYKPISTFNHNILEEKNLPADTRIVVYAPTFRKSRGNTFADALQDLEKLYEQCEKNNLLFIFKMHPLMENERAFISAKESMGDRPHFLFWDNKNDIYEIMHKVDLLVYDYSSIFSDFILAGVKNYIRYIFDGDNIAAAAGMNSDEEYFANSRGKICYTFDELLTSLDNYEDDEEAESLDSFIKTQWEYADDDDIEKTIDFTLNFKTKKTVYPALYSFDIFDTLITRKGLDPESVFYAMRDKLRTDNKYGFDKNFIEHFPSRRHHAEFGLREYMNKTMEQRQTVKREITLDMIYDEIRDLENLSREQRDYLLSLECESEIESVLPIKKEIDLVKSLLEAGQKVILISDMYLPMVTIRKMLEKADPVLADLDIYLSNEYGTLKSNSLLFFEVYRSKKPFYDYGKWIHTGDNINADQNQPRRLGIETRLVEKPEFSKLEKSIAESIGSYDIFKIMALQARMKKEYSFKSADFVIDFVAPIFVSYIDWAIQDAISKGFETLYFVSRDGHHLKRIADEIIKNKQYKLKTKYIYASRRVWRIPSYIDAVDDEFFANYGGNFNDIHNKEKFLRAACFNDENDFREIFPYIDLDTIDFDDWTDGQPAKQLAAILSSSSQYRNYLLSYAKEQRKIVCDYLAQEINPDEKCAFVEFFGRGYNQICHSRLWNETIGKEVPLYYYYARALLPSEGNCIRYKMTSTDIQFFFIEAIFANMPYKSIEEYKVINDKIVPVKVPIQCDKDLFNAMEHLLPEYAKRFSSLDLENSFSVDKQLFDSLLYYYSDHTDDPFIYQNVGTLVDSVSMFGEKRVFARPYTDEDIENFRNGIPRTRGTLSVTMSYMQSEPLTKIKYDELFQIEPGDDCATGVLLNDTQIARNREYIKKIAVLNKEAKSFLRSYSSSCIENEVVGNQVLILHTSKAMPDALKSVEKALLSNDSLNCIEYKYNKNTKKEYDVLATLMATSAFIIVNGLIPILSGLKLRDESKMIMAETSSFEITKKGYNTSKLIKSMNYYNNALFNLDIYAITAASDWSANLLQKKYGILLDESHIIKGSPVSDMFWDEDLRTDALEKLYELFPDAKGKKILLYLPSLRKMAQTDYYYNLLDIERLQSLIGDEYVILIDTRNHKDLLETVPNTLEIEGFSKVINSKISLRKLMMIADIIVGDYRDTLFESVLLEKPIFFSGVDYEKNFRKSTFDLDYTKPLPFPIVKSSEDLFDQIENLANYDYSAQTDFKNRYLTFCDGKSGEKLCDFIIESLNNNK
ncbi:MAG: CDP-glycerol glycerophosphotransferase family protein [Clostridiales bacterium]|nr:CDP-glycerol glycerophosphotransferase family protein [Clostridiales bacterium]